MEELTTIDFSTGKILVVGDIMLDKYYFGKVERISPEAPVPIVNITREESRLGGAANVANNICSLGGQALLCGTIGRDLFGKEVERLAKQQAVQAYFTKTDGPTITKARIIGERQQIVRLDYEQKRVPDPQTMQYLQAQIAELFPLVHLVVISDYGKGLVSDALCRFLIETAHEQGLPVLVDPKGKAWGKYAGATLITPNVKELGDVLGYSVPNDDPHIETAGKEVLARFGLTALLVTRSEQGMSLIHPDGVLHIPTLAQEVFDVSGAGDTVVATLALALATGKTITEAIHVANVAAGIVVRKIGTATLTLEELRQVLTKTK